MNNLSLLASNLMILIWLKTPKWELRLDSWAYLQVMFAMAESAVVWRSAAILLATKSGHEVPLASAVNAMTYAFIPEEKEQHKDG